MANVKQTVELLVLGVLSDRPQHAYMLRRSVEESIGQAQRISDGMLYPLLRTMEEHRSIRGSVEGGTNAPDKKVFALTRQGRNRLGALLAKPLECSGFEDKLDFFARYSLFGKVSKAERVRVLKERLAACDRSLDLLAKAAGEVANPYQLELLTRIVGSIDEECRWLIAKIEESREP
ncbi:MAG: PadR family transcriptional regulator [Candidatus Aquicultorales bacterium]